MERSQGFSLLEMAVVLVIISLMLGGLLVPLAGRVEQQRRVQAARQLDEAVAALLGYAAATGTLPCPARPDSDGTEVRSGSGCASGSGLLPNVTLGMRGAVNGDGLLLDPWDHPWRYAVSLADADHDGVADFVTAEEMRTVGLSRLAADLRVCEQAACKRILANNVPAVIYSLGANATSFDSADERANGESSVGGGPSGLSYALSNDGGFVSAPFNDAPNQTFDDVVAWISPNILYTRLIEAHRLP